MIGVTLSPAGAALAGESAAATDPCGTGSCVILHLGLPGSVVQSYPPISVATIFDSDFQVDGAFYPQRTVGGQAGPVLAIPKGLLISHLLSENNFNPAAVTSWEVVGGNGTAGPFDGTFLSDAIGAVAYVSGPADASMSFARQLVSSDPTDSNLADNGIASASNGSLDVYVKAPAPTALSVTDNRNKAPKVGQVVTFTVHVDAPVTNAKFSWTFPDGTSLPASAATSVTHTFEQALSGSVTATMTGDGGANGAGTETGLKVGPAAPAAGGTKPGTGKNTKKNAPPTGPTTGNGTRVGARPSHQVGTGTAVTNGTDQSPSQPSADAFSNLPIVTGRLISGAATVANLNATGAQETATAPGARVPTRWRLPLTILVCCLGALLLLGGAFSELRVHFRRSQA